MQHGRLMFFNNYVDVTEHNNISEVISPIYAHAMNKEMNHNTIIAAEKHDQSTSPLNANISYCSSMLGVNICVVVHSFSQNAINAECWKLPCD